jgi:NADPH-dependent 2,4-dienoyl-CoA reductase/sulfur reductase-like enzyme
MEVVRTVTAFDSDDVLLADGRRLDPDVVVCATGYRRNLEALVGHLGVLNQDGAPTVVGVTPAADGSTVCCPGRR